METLFELNLNTFLVPHFVKSDALGFSFLANVASQTLLLRNSIVVMDFEYCTIFETNLCAVLGNILQGLVERGNGVSFINLKGVLRGAISRNGFLASFMDNIKSKESTQNSFLPYKRFTLQDETEAINFFTLELFAKQNMPSMSPLARKEIIRNIFEVCLNALTHAECKYVYCCGQMYLRKKTPRVVLTITDLGKTIKANVNTHLTNTDLRNEPESMDGNKAIRWALTEGNTTKNKSIPGGLGLKLLQDLIRLNKGKLQLVSGDGFVEIHKGEICDGFIDFDFPGTIVSIELLLNDPNFYILKSEKDDWNDFF